MSIIVTEGTLDWAIWPFILATTAAAMGIDESARCSLGVRCKTSVEVIGGPIITVLPGSVWRGAFDLIYSRDILVAYDAPEFVAMPQVPGETTRHEG